MELASRHVCYLLGIMLAAVAVHGVSTPDADPTSTEEAQDGIAHPHGATYTRWGRLTCPENHTELVYSGVAAGQHNTHTGGGSNHLCLPMDPIWGNYDAAVKNEGILYGVEYQVAANNPLEGSSTGGLNKKMMNDQNVPCSVCRSLRAVSVLMIPARKECYKGWHREYHGYLMAAHHSHKGRTEYLCVDANPEADPAGYRNEDGALLFPVEGACGSLPCPPYVAGRELTCAVCSK